MTNTARLRRLIEDPGIVVLPGAHDVLSAKLDSLVKTRFEEAPAI